MPGIRGLAFDVQTIGKSDSFKDKFGTKELGLADSKKTAYRVPCINCKELLPLFKVELGNPGYDENIFSTPDQQFPLH